MQEACHCHAERQASKHTPNYGHIRNQVWPRLGANESYYTTCQASAFGMRYSRYKEVSLLKMSLNLLEHHGKWATVGASVPLIDMKCSEDLILPHSSKGHVCKKDLQLVSF